MEHVSVAVRILKKKVHINVHGSQKCLKNNWSNHKNACNAITVEKAVGNGLNISE